MKISDRLRSLTYSMDIQMSGFYFWCGNFAIQLGGTEVDDNLRINKHDRINMEKITKSFSLTFAD